jgi:hypothetical protein
VIVDHGFQTGEEINADRLLRHKTAPPQYRFFSVMTHAARIMLRAKIYKMLFE